MKEDVLFYPLPRSDSEDRALPRRLPECRLTCHILEVGVSQSQCADSPSVLIPVFLTVVDTKIHDRAMIRIRDFSNATNDADHYTTSGRRGGCIT